MKWVDSEVMAGGKRLVVRQGIHPRAGNRPVLVLLHEALGSIAQWKGFPERLAERCGCSVVIYERPGHGGSDPLDLPRPDDYLVREGRDRLPAVLDALGLERVVLVGHSDGGSIALVGAAVLGARVAGLVTLAAHVFVEPETRRGIEAAVAVYEEKLRAGLMRYHGDKTDILFRAWHETWLRESYQQLDLTSWLGAIRCPALIGQGRDDQYGTARQVEEICAGIGPGARPCWLPAAHMPHLEAEAETLEAVGRFADSLH